MFKLRLCSLDGKKEEMNLISAVLPTSDGNRTMLSNHMEAFIDIMPGSATFKTENKIYHYFVSEGIFHFRNNDSMMLVSAFEDRDELDFERARRAYDKAKRVLAETKNADELRKAEQALKRALGRLKLE